MDMTTLRHSLRSLAPLNVVVSTEPVHVIEEVYGLLHNRQHWLKVVTRYGVMDMGSYLKSKSLERGDDATVAPLKGLDEMQRQDPKDDQIIYVLPDLWPHLQDLEVMAALQRFRDHRLTAPRTVKMAVLVTPSLDYIPKMFHPWFDVHQDKGLTLEQAHGLLKKNIEMLGIGCEPEALEVIADLCRGHLSSEVDRMVAHAVVFQKPWREDMKLDPAGFRDWLWKHGYPIAWGLKEVARAVATSKSPMTTVEEVQEALSTGQFPRFRESQGKTLTQAAEMLWAEVETFRKSSV